MKTNESDLSFLRRYSDQKGGLQPLDNLLADHAALVNHLEKLIGYEDKGIHSKQAFQEARELLPPSPAG